MDQITNWRSFTRLIIMLAVASQVDVAMAQGTNEEIARIRERYIAINQPGLRYTVVARELDNYAVEGADLTGYFAGGDLRKVVARYFAESGFGREEYYFWNGELFFVLRRKNRNSQIHPNLKGVAQNRFYFASRQLIRWIDERDHLVVMHQQAARYEERHLLGEARKFSQLLVDARLTAQPQLPLAR